MTTLDIRVAFSAIDKLTRPAMTARRSAGALAESLKQTQANIKNLVPQAKSFSRLRDAFEKTNTQIQKAQRELSGLQAAQRSGAILTEKQRTLMASLTARLERLNEVRAREKERLRDATRAMTRHGISLAGGDRTIESAIRRTEQYNRQLTREQQMLAAVTRARQRYFSAREAGDRIKNAGLKMTVAGAAALTPIVAAAKSYSSLEDAMKGVSKQVSGLRDAGGNRTAQFGEMQKAIKDASEKLPMPNGAVDYAALVEGGARMGVANGDDPWPKQKKDLLDFANTAAMASKAFELPADQLSESLGKIAGLYKVPIQNIGRLGDVINYLDDNAKSKGADIIDVLQRVGGAADQLGYQNAAALGSTFLSLGEQSETAGTAVKAMVRELGNAMVQPERFMKGLDVLGLNAERVQKNMAKDAMGTIMMVMEATKKLSPDKQLNVLTQLFGDEYAMAVSKVANNLPELRRQLELTHSAASNGSMKRESDIDKDSLSSQWQISKAAFGNNLSALGESLRTPAMDLMKSITGVLHSVRGWIEANPALVAGIMKVTTVVGAALVAVGALAMTIGALLVPLALARLSFSLLAGEGGIAKVLTGIGRLGGLLRWIAGSPMQSLLATGRAVFTPLVSLVAGISAPVWGLIAVFAAVALAVIKFWEPIKAFFSGFFSGLMQGIQPIFTLFSTVFAPLRPLFDAIAAAIGQVWNWFKNLFEPIQFSADALNKCTSAGETFGRVVGAAIRALLTPVTLLMDALGWVLEKLGMIPDGIERARQKAEELQAQSLLKGKANALLATVEAIAPKEPSQAPKPIAVVPGVGFEALSSHGVLNRIANNTGDMLKETRKRIGPGDIVFKNLPRALAVRGEWLERTGLPSLAGGPSGGNVSPMGVPLVSAVQFAPTASPAGTLTTSRAAPSVSAQNGGSTSIGDIHVHLHGVTTHNPRDLAKMVSDAVKAELDRLARARRGSFRDTD
ncbi:phage tail tape measure protein [Edwardsiella piscicida]|uniref:phage tail tape measure protein n=1 Tax=Edwardsiella piscicida TaxID=1263550 RepID=UPI00370DBF62